jgi:hypothetical protein
MIVADNRRAVVTIGLPGSGKTTFLAALWHLVNARDTDTRLQFSRLGHGDVSYLHEIVRRWRSARVQERTVLLGDRIVNLYLRDRTNLEITLDFPDVAGEAFSTMWEKRECDPSIADMLRDRGVLLFIHADKITQPVPLVTNIAEACDAGTPEGDDQTTKKWCAEDAPTAVKIVSLLSMLREPPLDVGPQPRKLAIMLSAWDCVSTMGLTPAAYLARRMPLLDQYLRQAVSCWDFRIYGLSAQGCPYDKVGAPQSDAAKAILDQKPSTRIHLLGPDHESHDLTAPIEWLID